MPRLSSHELAIVAVFGALALACTVLALVGPFAVALIALALMVAAVGFLLLLVFRRQRLAVSREAAIRSELREVRSQLSGVQAAQQQHTEMVAHLVARGADLTVRGDHDSASLEALAADSMRFGNFTIVPGRVDFTVRKTVKGQQQTDNLYFKFSDRFIPSNDRIALALATFCGTAFAEIHFELTLAKDTVDYIAGTTRSKVFATISGAPGPATSPDGIALSFSGGFDSLSAYCVMPDDTKLVSIKFGGAFARESDFFEHFDTHIVETNFRELKYDQQSWTFMGVAAILYSDHLNIGYHAFGTILEGLGCKNIAAIAPPTDPIVRPQYAPRALGVAGMTDVSCLISGLTEVGTAMILNHYKPDLIEQSLTSLSAPGEEKLYRKQLLVDIVRERFGDNAQRTVDSTPLRRRYKFGDFIAIDLVFLYILKHRGLEAVSRVVSDLPDEAVPLVESLSLQWYERLNPARLSFVPEFMRDQYLEKLNAAGITVYTDDDWREFFMVREFISRHNAELRAAMADVKSH